MAELRGKWTDLIPDTGLKISEVFDQGDLLYTPGIPSIMHVRSGDGALSSFLGTVKLTVIRGTLRLIAMATPCKQKYNNEAE